MTGTSSGHTAYDDPVARSYDADREAESHWWAEDRFVKELFTGKTVRKMLDLPVGTGRFFPHYTGVQDFTGVDISQAMLSQARQRLPSLPAEAKKQLEEGDVFALCFADREFDTVIVWRLLHLIPDERLGQAIAELCRVTERELVVQTYAARPSMVAPQRKMTLWRKASNTVNELFVRVRQPRTPAEEVKPWSHIRAYSHPQSRVDSLFLGSGFSPSLAKVLDEYEHAEVRVTIYQRHVSPDDPVMEQRT